MFQKGEKKSKFVYFFYDLLYYNYRLREVIYEKRRKKYDMSKM